MTTQVTISANHGWPVRVTPLSANGGPVGPTQIVEAGATGQFSVLDSQDLLIHEIQPGEGALLVEQIGQETILQFFAFAHLPGHLQAISMPFAKVADRIVQTLPRNAERSVALRKLLEAKDAAVRAAVAV
jgi:hypothetical protein